VAFVAALSSFVSTTRADLTVRAAGQVPVDWQIQVTAQGDPAAVGGQVASLPGLRAQRPVAHRAGPALRRPCRDADDRAGPGGLPACGLRGHLPRRTAAPGRRPDRRAARSTDGGQAGLVAG
jgi:hypothetical protein